MTKVNNLSLKDKILNYLKRGIALVSATVTVVSVSKTSAKAEGNSNLPNPTNIEEQTNTPIPSAGEDVIVANEIKNEIIDKGTWINDSYNYTTREYGKYAHRNPQIDNNIGRTSAIFHFPYNDKGSFDFWVENGFLSIDGDELVDFRMEDGSILSLDIDGLQENFYLTTFEMFGDILYSYANSEIDKAIKQGKEITVEFLMENGPDFSKLYPEKLQPAYKQNLELTYSVLIDLKTTKKKDKLRAGTKGFIPLLENIIGVGDPRDINKMLKRGIAIIGVDDIKEKIYKKMYQSDGSFDKWKVAVIFVPVIERITYDNATTNEEVERCFKKDPNTNKWVYVIQPNNRDGGAQLIKNDFEYICVIYQLIENFKMESTKYLRDYTFAEGTKYRALWENGGMEDFDETQYIIPEENGISK